MAKSLRSKSRRRNVRAKREKYQAKHIEQLKKTLGLTKEAEKIRREEILKDLSDIAAGIEASKNNSGSDSIDVAMEENGAEGGASDTKESKKTKVKDGQHPVWKSQRKIKAAKKNAQKAKKKIGKKSNKKNKGSGGKEKK